jgi:release factor glutamine methyltransferase
MGTPDAAIVDAPAIAEVRRALAATFRAAGIESPDLDARILTAHALGIDPIAVAADSARPVKPSEQAAITALAQRRLNREPVARIVGQKEFWSLTLRLNSATLVPRPETETVVEAALAAIDAYGFRSRPLRIADLGTGSGALALALLSELPHAFAVGTDLSVDALFAARANARRLGLDRAVFVACDMVQALRGPFDVIVSNPPYIASRDIAGLDPEVRVYDAQVALDGGPDGLNAYRAIAATVPALLAPGGALVVELGLGQMEPVTALFAAAGLAPLLPRPDLNGVPRALVGVKRA